MIGRFVRKVHHVLKSIPGLKWLDAAAIFLWFGCIVSIARFACYTGLLCKLIAVTLYYRKRLVVLCRFGGVGDIICSFPAVREFIRQNIDVQVVYVTRTIYRDLIRRSDLGIHCITTGMHVIPSDWATRLFRRCLELNYADEAATINEPPLHLVQEFAKCLGLAPVLEDPTLRIDALQVKKIRDRYLPDGKQHFVLLHTGPTWKVREWPLASWTALVARLQENSEILIFQIVNHHTISVKDASCELVPGAIPIDCTDNISRLIDTIAAADLLIGIDSGPVHIAAAVGTRVIALFGPIDPALRLPKSPRVQTAVHLLPCSFCHHRRPRLHWLTGCPMQIACMQNITVEQILQISRDFLPQKSSKGFVSQENDVEASPGT